MPAESVSHRVATARGFVGKLWKLSAPYWWAEDVSESRVLGMRFALREKWIARGLLAVVIILLVLDVYVAKLFNDWYGRFYNALEVRDSAVYWVELQYFTLLAFISIAID
ncbi:MAG TPA: hypothetical protein VF606_07630, partial [Geminicoccaceae bacterium]